MNRNLIDKIKETSCNLISSVRKFGDDKTIEDLPKEIHITGEQEFPGELTDIQNDINNF